MEVVFSSETSVTLHGVALQGILYSQCRRKKGQFLPRGKLDFCLRMLTAFWNGTQNSEDATMPHGVIFHYTLECQLEIYRFVTMVY
jgi:hypothetical protein